jgi:hypothetical protein
MCSQCGGHVLGYAETIYRREIPTSTTAKAIGKMQSFGSIPTAVSN